MSSRSSADGLPSFARESDSARRGRRATCARQQGQAPIIPLTAACTDYRRHAAPAVTPARLKSQGPHAHDRGQARRCLSRHPGSAGMPPARAAGCSVSMTAGARADSLASGPRVRAAALCSGLRKRKRKLRRRVRLCVRARGERGLPRPHGHTHAQVPTHAIRSSGAQRSALPATFPSPGPVPPADPDS